MKKPRSLMPSVAGAALVAAMAAAPAPAASPDAWKQHDKAVVKACTDASQLKGTKTLGKPTLFSDDVGYTALLLQGRYPQKHMKNRLGRELCLFERKSGTAHVTEADAFGR